MHLQSSKDLNNPRVFGWNAVTVLPCRIRQLSVNFLLDTSYYPVMY